MGFLGDSYQMDSVKLNEVYWQKLTSIAAVILSAVTPP